MDMRGGPDNGQHPLTVRPRTGRASAAEAAATDGAQYTDTYSTTHPGSAPAGNGRDVLYTGLGSGWTVGHLEIDMADFQASTFGAVAVTFNGIAQNWAYNDGFRTRSYATGIWMPAFSPRSQSRSFDHSVDRNQSNDFYVSTI